MQKPSLSLALKSRGLPPLLILCPAWIILHQHVPGILCSKFDLGDDRKHERECERDQEWPYCAFGDNKRWGY